MCTLALAIIFLRGIGKVGHKKQMRAVRDEEALEGPSVEEEEKCEQQEN